MISSGFSFDDGQQILVSIQKPMGIVFQQGTDEETEDATTAATAAPIVVGQVDPTGSAGRAGVQVGDVLVAVQNASVESADLDQVLEFIQKGPRVMNLRLVRDSTAK
jgi:C-terminal processing protease CtpA/Prc